MQYTAVNIDKNKILKVSFVALTIWQISIRKTIWKFVL